MSDETKRIIESGEVWLAEDRYAIAAGDGFTQTLLLSVKSGDKTRLTSKSEADVILASCAPEALRMLMAVVDAGYQHGGWVCPVCRYHGIEDHADDCAWVALMCKAGLR